MKATVILASALSLVACDRSAQAQNEQQGPANQTANRPASVAPAKRFAFEEKSKGFELAFSWPAEASAIPELAKVLRSDLETQKAQLSTDGDAEPGEHPHFSSTVYETAGQSGRLLSLSVDVSSYEGGAHGNFGVGALLWDRSAKKEIAFADLFAQPANRDRLLTQRWCDALGKAREEKRGEPVGGGGLFDDCPGLDDIAVIPADKDKDGRFDQLTLVASPYVAGPWVEGAYEIELGITADLIAALKREYQPSFEARVQTP